MGLNKEALNGAIYFVLESKKGIDINEFT